MDKIIEDFHKLWFANRGQTWSNTKWMGVSLEKNPLDLHVYQEILYEVQPNLIIEAGTGLGGSALFLANMCDLIGKGSVITIDVEIRNNKPRPEHPRIKYIIGSSTEQSTIEKIKPMIKENCLVILDSDHSKYHVLNELAIYSQFVTKNSYIIVEDSCISGHPLGSSSDGEGPYEAIEEFLKTNKDFEIDKSREKYMMTFNPNGYLRRNR